MTRSFTRLPIAAAILLALVGDAARAGEGEGDRWTLAEPLTLTRPAQDNQEQPRPAGWYDRFVEVSLSDEMFQLGYRQLTHRHRDYYGAYLLANEDDDIAVHGRLVRQGQLVGHPLRFGVGLGAYAVFLDEPGEDVYALSLIGVAEYDLATSYPTTVAADLAIAPKIATFDDGEDLVEFRLRVNVDLSEVASGFLGYRLLDVGTDTDDFEVDDGFHLGIRLAL